MTDPIDVLVRDLQAVFRADAKGAAASGLLETYAAEHDDWRRFAFFGEGAYTRNLIESNANFELILLCWSAGQKSPVHNHEGQRCWMTVLEGTIQEDRFDMPTRPGPLVPGPSSLFPSGKVAFIRDEIGLHVVHPSNGAPGVSLHLYANPIPACNCYCEETGKITRKQLGFYSIRGRRTAAQEL